MPKVLITGGTGFVGRHSTRLLCDLGHEVHVVSRTAVSPIKSATFHCCDLLQADQRRTLMEKVRPTHLLHLAWSTEPRRFWTSAANLDWMAASLDLMQSFKECGGQRAVFAGTCAEYDWAYHTLSERDTPCNPATLYGKAKNGLHTVAAEAAEQWGLSLAWGRVFFLYGPGEKPGRLISDLVVHLLEGREFRCSEGRQLRDFMHVADVARALVELLLSEFRGPVNIASGEAIAVRDVILTAADMIGRRDLIRFGATPAAVNDQPCLAATVSILRGEVGFKPSYTLQSGLRNTVDWWRAQLAEQSAAALEAKTTHTRPAPTWPAGVG
jgi:nucleoside-diphosphate-sugar epimerase